MEQRQSLKDLLIGDDGEFSKPVQQEFDNAKEKQVQMLAIMSDLEETRNFIGNFCLTAGRGKSRALIFTKPANYKNDYLVITCFGCSFLHFDSSIYQNDFDELISKAAKGNGHILPFSYKLKHERPEFSFFALSFQVAFLCANAVCKPVQTERESELVEQVIDHVKQTIKEKVQVQKKADEAKRKTETTIRDLFKQKRG